MIKLKAPFQTGTTCTGHPVREGICFVHTQSEVEQLLKHPHNFEIVLDSVDDPVVLSDENLSDDELEELTNPTSPTPSPAPMTRNKKGKGR
jgi:hypothetical protein